MTNQLMNFLIAIALIPGAGFWTVGCGATLRECWRRGDWMGVGLSWVASCIGVAGFNFGWYCLWLAVGPQS